MCKKKDIGLQSLGEEVGVGGRSGIAQYPIPYAGTKTKVNL